MTARRHGSLWGRLLYRLSHRAEQDRAETERDRRAATIASAAEPGQAELALLVSSTLVHQGPPLENARMVAELLRDGRSYGWDEASYDIDGERVEVSFLGETRVVDRAELRALVERIVTRLEALEGEAQRAP